MRWISAVVLVWLIIGAVAAAQRGYFTHASENCASGATTAVTVVAGPLNYLGVNPKVAGCKIPQPSP
ncbi:hypothetical protein [Tsukamurella soli]|uniref:Uncharacterized protein n=1 Tax=Tsukamurella soli TaxID=644556 RepID=A0ABP8J5R3_9ACTN